MPDCFNCELFKGGQGSSACMHLHRPGGLKLTTQLIESCDLSNGAHVLDLACGSGETLNYINEQRMKGIGFDLSRHMLLSVKTLNKELNISEADFLHIPIKAKTQDAVLLECSWVLSNNSILLLDEIKRVLKPGGKLAITDIYVREVVDPEGLSSLEAGGCLAQATTKEKIIERIIMSGLKIQVWSDQTPMFKQWMSQMIFKFGSIDEFYRRLCTSKEGVCNLKESLGKTIKIGYYMLIAQT